MREPGTLYVVATPIGNRGDITLRALATLEHVELVLAEDTRQTRKLFSLYPDHRFDVQLLRFDEHADHAKVENLTDQLSQGMNAALLSDAGTPQVSDPGGRLVDACRRRGIRVVPIPGASALTAILSVADFAAQPVAFYGFLPKKKGRETTLRRLREMGGKYGLAAAILYESPERVGRTFTDLASALGDKTHVVVGRELTKQFEEVWYGTLAEAQAHFTAPKGEFVLLVALAD